MSNEQNGLSGIDNLTPFEYALAGVTPTSSQDSPSLTVIDQMRALANEVQDAPISQVRLQDFITGGANKRNDRRGFKRRRAAADGGFVDITPVELAEQNLIPSAGVGESRQRLDSIEPAAFADIPTGVEGDFEVIFDETEPTSEQPAISVKYQEPEDQLSEDQQSEDHVPDDLLSEDQATDELTTDELATDGLTAAALTDDGDQAVEADSALNGMAESDFAREFDAIQAAMMDSEPTDEPTFYNIPIDVEPSASDETLWDQVALDDAAVDGAGFLIAEDQPTSQLAADDSLFVSTDDKQRDTSGRFAGDSLFGEHEGVLEPEQALTSDHPDDGTAVLVPAIGGEDGLLLDDESEDGRSPLAVAALTGVVPSPVPERRFGGAFWALAGTAAAAAVLALGGLLWANSLNDRTKTESAAASTDTEQETQTSTDASTSEASTESEAGSDSSATGALAKDPEAEQDRPALAVDGADTGTSTTLDPESPSVTTDPSANTASTNADNTSEDPTTETTDQTDAPTTTLPPTTEPATTEPPVTEPPPTEPPPTEPPVTEPPPTQPPTTPAPVVRPTFVGDRVTLGSFDGPGVGGVRVRLYSDVDGNGTSDQLLSNDVTDDGGFYGFDQFPTGCYVIDFTRIPAGLNLDAGQSQQSFCLGEGDQNGRLDAVVAVSPPDGCLVERSDGRYDRGVEVHENDFDRATSYTFYNQSGGVVFKTSGAPDDYDENPYGDYEWFGPANDFDHRRVRSVAAERFGVESTPLTCDRD